MENDTSNVTILPTAYKLSKWEEWREIVYFIAVVITSAIVIWHWPSVQTIAPLILLCIGLLFDLVSLIARISTAITGRYSSGFFTVGLAFYVWAWLSYPHTVLLREGSGLFSLWLWKIPDITCMTIVHFLIHVSYEKKDTEHEVP